MGLGEFGAPLEDRDPLEELDALPDSRDIQARRPTFDPSRFGSTLPKGVSGSSLTPRFGVIIVGAPPCRLC